MATSDRLVTENGKAMKLTLSTSQGTPYYRVDKPTSDPGTDDRTTMFKAKIINRFVLARDPFTQIIVGLKGLYPDIMFSRPDQIFNITWEEMENLESTTEKTTLSSKQTDGGIFITNFSPKEKGAVFEKILEPYSCPMEQSECEFEKFELSRYEVQQLKKQLPAIKTAVTTLIDNRSTFDSMYGLIVMEMQGVCKTMKIHEKENYHEIVHRFKMCITPAFMVRQFLSNPLAPLAPFQLYHVLDVCLNQHAYLKERFEFNNLYMSWQ